MVVLRFSKERTKKFAKGTSKYLKQNIGIYLDGKMLSNPVVQTEIDNGKAVITGMKDLNEAKTLVQQIRAGLLLFGLKVVESNIIKPLYNQNNLELAETHPESDEFYNYVY